ncbi:MAG TPA: class III lanthionine synthetase LanKC [Micromonosporaceae bacterium]|nr:class III lanthionine synthetase LanKC [Micromonosporaceae bacterium]
MIERYEMYCLADRIFYDSLEANRSEHPDFAVAGRPVPEGWDHEATDTWMHYAPQATTTPEQGWKIHVSARMADMERVLDAVWAYCVAQEIPFKFLRSRPVAMMFNAKSAFRGSSGKLATIYPADTDRLEVVLKELDGLLAGTDGPYILSDLKCGDGPIFVRYGAFTERYCLGADGQRVLALTNGDGELVPDLRGPTFTLPPWVTLPPFLEAHLAARNAVTTTGLPYDIESVLHFSNGGGVYLGRDRRTGEQVVLKEGRPYAGLDIADRDAVTRLRHERDILERLTGLDVVPRLIDYFTLGDHHFLVQEFIDGNPLQRMLVQRYPLTRADCAPQAVAEYTAWVLDMLGRVERAVDALHGRGVVFGDLHPDNILVTADGRVVLIDFEVSTLAADRARSALAHPAFAAPADRQGVDVDRYALACLRLGMFAPQTTIMLQIHRAKAEHLGRLIAREFDLPAAFLDEAIDTLLGSGEHRDAGVQLMRQTVLPDADPQRWPVVRAAMCRAIVASATPERDDRLFPGDVAQFEPGGGINVAYGAAGVLYALAVTGAGRFPEYDTWLRTRALDAGRNARPGLYNGLHGVAHVLDVLGYPQDALDIVDRCSTGPWDDLELGLFSGLSGVGLNLLNLGTATGETELIALAGRIVDRCADRLGGADDVPEISGGSNPRAGLLYGSAGPALLFLHAYTATGDAGLLDLAAVALRQDLRRCVRTRDGSLQVNQDWRTLPYLDEGSAGIGVVLARYLAHRHDEEFAAALRDLQLVTAAGYYVQSGLFTGRSGLLAALGMGLRPADDDAQAEHLVAAQLDRLAWHALPYGGGLAFVGDQLLRLSMDLGTGTAGVLLAIGAALHDGPVSLPFLPPVDRVGVAATTAVGTGVGGTVRTIREGR